jgi:hypothetical protein
MPAFNSSDLLKNIRFDQLKIENGELSGDLISGGVIKKFASTGIEDHSSMRTLKIVDGAIIVDKIITKKLEGAIELDGSLSVTGDLKADKLYVSEIISKSTFDKTYLEFQPVEAAANPDGSGLIWKGKDYTKLFVLKSSPNRFFSSESIDVPMDKSYKIDNVDVLNKNTLGPTIRKSSLREVGTLHSLSVTGDVSLSEFISINSDQQRIAINVDQPMGILSISDTMKDVIINIDIENGRAKIGTYNNRPLDITAGDMSLITLDPKGIVNLGNEYKSDILTRLWGKIGVNVKNPDADLEIRGGFRFGGKLFLVDNSPPIKGNYKRGDIVWNESPGQDSPIGWICTVSGTPGIWNQFGVI